MAADDRFVDWLKEQDSKRSPLWSEVEYVKGNRDGDARPYFVKVAASAEDEFSFLVTNFVYLWTESMTPAEFRQRFKDVNPNLETNADLMMNEIREIVLGRRRCHSVDVDRRTGEDERLKITFKAMSDGLPLQWKSVLEKAPSEKFYFHIVMPLMTTVMHYQRRESVLANLMSAKDQEHKRVNTSSGQSRDQKASFESHKFRYREWSETDLRSKEFTKMQRNVRPEKLSGTVVSNELYAYVCLSDIFIRDQPDAPATDDQSADTELERQPLIGSSPARLGSALRDNALESSKHPSCYVEPPPVVETLPPHQQRKQKRLRL